MGERDNGYVRCELRRGRGAEMQQRSACLRCKSRDVGEGCRCGDHRDGGCGICHALYGGMERSERAYAGRSKQGVPDVRGKGHADHRCGCESDRPLQGACAAKECHELMHQLQQLDFSIQEVVLYLDGYPDCPQALDYYHQLVEERRAVAQAYEKSCGPLNAYGNHSAHEWEWVKSPWPWQNEFPGNRHG